MSIRKALLSTAAAASCLTMATPAHASFEPFIGQIMPFGGNFCPRGYLQASGQLISISSNTALFSLLGTTYGGDGVTTFALPNLNGRTITSDGTGPGLPNYVQGQTSGTNQFTLTTNNMPSHTHVGALRAVPTAGNTEVPTDNSMAQAPAGTNIYSTAAPTNNMNAGDVVLAASGGSQPIAHQAPYLIVKHCIATEGIFPSRN